MLLKDLLRTFARRWYIVAPLALLSVLASVAVYGRTAPTYSTSASLLMLPPKTPVDAQRAQPNPFRGFDSSLAAAGSVVAIALSDEQTAQELERGDPTLEYAVSVDPSTFAPVVNISVVSKDGGSSMRSLERLVEMFSTELDDRQRGVGAPPNTWIGVSVISASPEPEVALGRRVRAALAVGAFGALVAMGLTFAVDGWSARRRRPKRAQIAVISHAAVGGARRPVSEHEPPALASARRP